MKQKTLVLDKSDTKELLAGTSLLTAMSAALIAIARGDTIAPPRPAVHSSQGFLTVMPGFVENVGIGAKVTSIFATDVGESTTAHLGVVALFDDKDGSMLSLLDAEEITARRTSAVTTLAWQNLSHDISAPICVIGTGFQAESQLAWFEDLGVHTETEIMVAGRSREKLQQIQKRFPWVRLADVESGVRNSQAIFCCTGSAEPLFPKEWLQETVFVSSVGGASGPEIDTSMLQHAHLFIEWPGAQTELPSAGAHEFRGYENLPITLLGDVIDAETQTSRDGITLFKSTGHAALDLAAARLAYEQARGTGIGVEMQF